MLKRLYISPLVEIISIGDDKISFSIVGRRYTVEDRIGMFQHILSCVENGVETDKLKEDLLTCFPLEAIDVTLKSLIDAKVLVHEDGRSSGNALQQYLDHRREQEGIFTAETNAAYAIQNWMVFLAGNGVLANALKTFLMSMGISVECIGTDAVIPASDDKRVLLLVCDDYENFDFFRQMSRQAIERKIASFYLGMDWNTVQCGPLVIPKATACYECYYHRVRASRKFVAEFDARSKPENILYCARPNQLAVQWAVAEGGRVVMQYLNGTLGNLHQSVFSEINTINGEINRSMILRLPRCPVCGNANTARPVGRVFQNALLRPRD